LLVKPEDISLVFSFTSPPNSYWLRWANNRHLPDGARFVENA
jgi:hypothetical protein